MLKTLNTANQGLRPCLYFTTNRAFTKCTFSDSIVIERIGLQNCPVQQVCKSGDMYYKVRIVN